MDALIGRKLDGRYQIMELIGSGGMANVYKATDILENRIVAVKVLREEFMDNEELVRRFKNESKAISMLSHPNIVQVYDVNFSDKVQYIVMEYIDGINFMQYLESEGRLEWQEALHFTVQVLHALSHAHDRGIVHRDIKPQNIMVLRDGSIKVMDFGIARFARSQTRTVTDKAIGSVHYISPEQAMGEETDAKSDIYSLGVMLYEMLTGQLPFESDSAVSVALKQISDEPVAPRTLVPEIPEALEEITLKAMAKDPAARYQSASEMLKDIEEFKKNPDIRFDYKYQPRQTEPTRHFDAVAAEKGKAAESGMPKIAKAGKKGKKEKKAKKEKVKRQRGWAIPVLLGITIACFLGAILLAYMVFTAGENSIFNRHTEVNLPHFSGMTIEEIKADKAYSQKFRFEVVEEYSSEVPAGQVIKQDPVPPITVLDNAKITLYVSKGVEYVTVPEITGYSYSEAFDALTSAKLAVRVETVSESKPENEVIRTKPVAGEVVEAYTVVTVYVQRPTGGSTTLYVPDLEGKDVATAKLLLTANGMSLGEIKEEYSDTVEAGKIISQSIKKNTVVSLNTKVDIVVSLGRQKAELTVHVTGAGSYAVSATVNGNAISIVGGTGTAQLNDGETAVIIVTITNTANGEHVETSTQTIVQFGSVNFVNVDVSSIIPASWSQAAPDPGNDPGNP